jgi:acetylornithine deacetylase/succinyl-diaminopimelate desuccinylase-like protein
MFGVPTVGFGPADERYAHTPDDQCPIAHLTREMAFYAAFPQAWLAAQKESP